MYQLIQEKAVTYCRPKTISLESFSTGEIALPSAQESEPKLRKSLAALEKIFFFSPSSNQTFFEKQK